MEIINPDALGAIKAFLVRYPYLSANYNLVTIYLWSVAFPSYYLIEDDVLYIFEEDGEELVALMPITSKEKLPGALTRLEEIFQEQHKPFLIEWAPEEQALIARQCGYQIDVMEEYREYVHWGESLRTLKGKKMQKKRNHYNYFIKNYDYSCRLLNQEDFPAIWRLIEEWLRNKDNISPFVQGELLGIKLLFDLYEVLDYCLFGVFIDGQLKAFSLGSFLTADMVEVNIEKADPNIRGLYPFLASSFQQHCFPDALLVNREDDAGDEKLKRSKLSYYPCQFLQVYRISCVK